MNDLSVWSLSPRRVLAALVAVITLMLVIIGQVAGAGDRQVGNIGLSAGIAVPFTILGVLVLMSVPRHPVGRLMTAAGLTAAVHLLALSWTAWTPSAWVAQWAWVPAIGLVLLAVLLFPEGQLPSSRWRLVAGLIVVGTVVGTVLLAVVTVNHPRLLTGFVCCDSPLSATEQQLFQLAVYAVLLAVIGYLGALLSLGRRWRDANAETRRQLACLLAAGLVLLAGLVLDVQGIEGAWAVAVGAVPLGMAVAILRYRLYDVDLLVNRTIVWVLMTALVVVGVTAIVKILSGELFQLTRDSAQLLAIGVAVVTFEPLHRKVQRGVNRLLYGDLDDPYLVIARLGEVLGRTADPTAVMPLVTRTIAESLQVPYVAVELAERDGPVLVVEHGRPLTVTESFDMMSHGKRIGRLLVARRSTGGRFSRHECRLLRDAALQAAVAAEAVRLSRDVQTARERLVMAREEERRRLRRDLHDGLGPSLAGMSMQVRAAWRLLPADSRAAEILDALAADLKTCTAEVRQLVDELRPPALDRGLCAALRGECERFNAEGLSVRCAVDGNLEGLPAAVEVAAFRIVAEALTNVARHSRAHYCNVTVHRDGVLRLEVTDDGVGLVSAPHAGVGLSSMRERAAELGGDCIIGPAPGRGTSVRVELPLSPAQRVTPSLEQL